MWWVGILIRTGFWTTTRMTHMRCPHCGSSNIAYEDGELVCRSCGTVIQDHVFDLGPEWRGFEAEERARTGPFQKDPNGLGSTIQLTLPERFREKLRMLAVMHSRIKTDIENELRRELMRQASILNLPTDYIDEALAIYRENRAVLEGRPISVQAVVLLMIVARRRGVALRPKNVLRQLGLVNRLGLVDELYNELAPRLGVRGRAPIEGLIAQAVQRLGLPFDITNRAVQLLRRVPRTWLGGKSSTGVAGALLWLACLGSGDGVVGKCTQEGIANVLGISPLTIRSRARELARLLGVPSPT
jgi:transcription initiation factor TFIIB